MSALDDYDDDVCGGGGGADDDDYDDENDNDRLELSRCSLELAAQNNLPWCHWCRSMRQRLRLMCSSSALSVVAFRMASPVDKFSGGSRLDHAITLHILRRCSSVLAWRLWMGNSEARVRSVGDREIIHKFTHQQRLKERQENENAELKRQQLAEDARHAELKYLEQQLFMKTGAVIAVVAVAWTWPYFALYFTLLLVLVVVAFFGILCSESV
jgi:hypothetical protein